MTDPVGVLDHQDRRRRRRWPLILAAFAVVIVAAGVPITVWFVHWRSSLHALVDYPAYGESGPLAMGKTQFFGNTLIAAHVISHPNTPGELSLHISAIRPVVDENTAGADVTVLRCVLAQDGPGPDGVYRTEAESICSSLRPIRSGAVTLGINKGDDDLVVAVTPRHAGTVRISGVEVHYSSGMRHGTQHTGAQLKTTTS